METPMYRFCSANEPWSILTIPLMEKTLFLSLGNPPHDLWMFQARNIIVAGKSSWTFYCRFWSPIHQLDPISITPVFTNQQLHSRLNGSLGSLTMNHQGQLGNALELFFLNPKRVSLKIGCFMVIGQWWFSHFSYPLVNIQKTNWKDPPFSVGKSTINGPCSIAMLNYQRVTILSWSHFFACLIIIFWLTRPLEGKIVISTRGLLANLRSSSSCRVKGNLRPESRFNQWETNIAMENRHF